VGIFTFLFTDIEGSTALVRRLGEGLYAQLLADHHLLIRSVLAAHDGREVDTQGDAFFVVFSSPRACVVAVLEMQRALQAHAWPAGEHVRVRMGVHTGEAAKTATGMVGLEVHRAARWRLPDMGARSCCRRRRLSWYATCFPRARRCGIWVCTG
jgi:class 3 adenylate cyclase